jgi:hypothetical protein
MSPLVGMGMGAFMDGKIASLAARFNPERCASPSAQDLASLRR